MLKNKFTIEINSDFTLDDFSQMIEIFLDGSELYWLLDHSSHFDDMVEYYEREYEEYNLNRLVEKIRMGKFEKIILPHKEIEKIKREATVEMNFHKCQFCKITDFSYIRRFARLNDLGFVALTIENGVVTNLFDYREGLTEMVIVIDCEDDSKFEKFFKDYRKKLQK